MKSLLRDRRGVVSIVAVAVVAVLVLGFVLSRLQRAQAFGGDGVVQSDPTEGNDSAKAIAVDSSAIYVAGYQATGEGCSTGGGCWRVEKRDLTTGALITAFDSDGVVQSDPTSGGDYVNAIAIDSSAIYVLGSQDTGAGCSTGLNCWRVEKRDKTTGALVTAFDSDGVVQSDPTSGGDWPSAIAVDSSAIYVAGYQSPGAGCSAGSGCWRVEKRDLTTGALITVFDSDGVVQSDPTSGDDWLNAIAIDSTAIYVAGSQETGAGCSTGGDCWRVEERDKTTGALITAFDSDGVVQSDPTDGSDWANAIAVDSSAIYVLGPQATGAGCSTGQECWRVEKRDKTTGALITAFDGDGIVQSDPTGGGDYVNAIAVESSAIYVLGSQGTGTGCSTGNWCWRVEKRDKTTGALVSAFDSDGVVQSDPTSGYDWPSAIAVDSSAIYVAGYQDTGAGCSTGGTCWRVEKRNATTGELELDQTPGYAKRRDTLEMPVFSAPSRHNILFTTTTQLNDGGNPDMSFKVLFPTNASGPDPFAIPNLAPADVMVSCTSCNGTTFTVTNVVVAAEEGSDNDSVLVVVDASQSLPAGSAVTIVLGTGSTKITNPPDDAVGCTAYATPSADICKVTIQTSESTSNPITPVDSGTVLVALVSGVGVVASIAEEMIFSVNTVSSGDCDTDFGNQFDATVTASSVDFGSVPVGAFSHGCHDIVISANASANYYVTAEESSSLAGTVSGAFDSDGVAQSDPTSGSDNAYAIATDSSAIYVAGSQYTGAGCSTGTWCWRVEKRDKTTGALVTAFDSDGIVQSDPTSGDDEASAIAVDASAIYVAGTQDIGPGCSIDDYCWRIEKRDKTTGELISAFDGDGVVQSDPTSGSDWASAIAVDASAIYVAGYQATGAGCSTGEQCWRIEKRDKTTGELITAFDGDGVAQSDPTDWGDYAYAIAADSSAIYIAGYQDEGGGCTTGGTCWRVEKRDKTTGVLITAFDSDGVIQSDPTAAADEAYAIAVDSSAIYVAGLQDTNEGCSAGGWCWRVEKRDKTTGELITAFDGDGVAQSDPTDGGDYAYAIAADSSAIYVAGVQATGAECSTGFDCWRVEKRDKTTGELITAFDGDGVAQSDPTSGYDRAQAIAVDSNAVYVTGLQGTGAGCSTGSNCWRVEKRDLTTGELTVGHAPTIDDTLCDGGTCSETVSDDWTNAAANGGSGFGLSCVNKQGTPCDTAYTTPVGICNAAPCYRQFSCQGSDAVCDPGSGEETYRTTVLTGTSPVKEATGRVEYRLSIGALQEADLYSNTIVYVATVTF